VDKTWEDWFGGLQVTHLELAQDSQPNNTCSPTLVEVTVLTGQVEDQAALLGTLQKLYAFGLPILSLELVPPGG